MRSFNACTLIAVGSLAFIGGWSPPSQNMAQPLGYPSITKAYHDTELAFAMPGRIELVAFKPGDHVTAGSLLARLEDDELEAQVSLSEIRANDTATIAAAKATCDNVDDTLRRMQAAFADNGANQKEVNDATTRAVSAHSELTLAMQKVQEAKCELKMFQARLDRTRLVAPFSGVVEAVNVEQGSAIDEHVAAIRLVDTSKLKINVYLPSDRTLSLYVGQRLPIRFRGLPLDDKLERGSAMATIVSMAEVADAASRMREVRLEMENTACLPAGLPVEVFLPDATPATAAASEE